MKAKPERLTRTLLVVTALLGVAAPAWADADTSADRLRMVEDMKIMASEVADETGIASLSARVLDRMAEVPRHEFVPPEQKASAYRNRPLAIGHAQTISQPFVVALMTDLLEAKENHRVLEIGTGSGYQAAVLAGLVRDVYTIEIVRPLAETAAAAFERLGYANIHTRIGDGYRGWPEYGPYDGIMVTAAPDHIPPALIEQLKPGGRLVIPVGEVWQDLLVLTKNADGTTTRTTVVPVRFVPLTRDSDTPPEE